MTKNKKSLINVLSFNLQCFFKRGFQNASRGRALTWSDDWTVLNNMEGCVIKYQTNPLNQTGTGADVQILVEFEIFRSFCWHANHREDPGGMSVHANDEQISDNLHLSYPLQGRREAANSTKGNVSVEKHLSWTQCLSYQNTLMLSATVRYCWWFFWVASCSFHAADSCGFTCLASSLCVSSNSTVTPRCVTRCRARLGWPELRQTTREPTVF